MSKKFISIMLSMVTALSAFAFAASAAEVEDETVGAEVEVESSGSTGTVKFEDPWNSSSIYFHIWDASNDDENTKFATKNGWAGNSWGSKKIKGTKVEGEENIWESFEFEIPDGHDVFIIFANENGMQTYDCVINGNCFGDTARITGNSIENPVDSEKTAIEAVFDNNPDCGPYLQITSTGNIVGSCTAPSNDGTKIVADYIWNMNGNVDKSGVDCVTPEKVQNALNAFGTDAESVWARYQELHSNDEGYADKQAAAKEVLGIKDSTSDTDSDSDDDDNSSNNNSSKTTSGTTSTKSGTTTTTSKSGTTTTGTTADTAATGDATGTVAFAVVLVAAALVVIAARKKVQE